MHWSLPLLAAGLAAASPRARAPLPGGLPAGLPALPLPLAAPPLDALAPVPAALPALENLSPERLVPAPGALREAPRAPAREAPRLQDPDGAARLEPRALRAPPRMPGGAAPRPTADAVRSREKAVGERLRGVEFGGLGGDDAHSLGADLESILRGEAGRARPGLPAGDDGPSLGRPRADEAAESAGRAPESGGEAAEGPSTPSLLARLTDPRLRAAIRSRIYTDPLTGLYRRSWLQDNLGEIMAERRSLLLLDLDHFKRGVNDRFGHDVGDIAISEVAAILKETIGGRGVPVRWGGEEFLVVGDWDQAEAERVAARLLERVGERLAPAVNRRARERLGRELGLERLTVSIGVSPILRSGDSDHSSWVESLEEADRLLYKAKEAGRNAFRSARDGVWALAAREPSAASGLLRTLRRLFPVHRDRSILSGRFAWSRRTDGETVDGLLAQVTDPALRRRLSERIYTDPLTRAWNRAHLRDHLPARLAANRSILILDVDHFKRVNDDHGHNKGDDVLVALTRILAEFAGEPAYRMGGEEFLVFLPQGVREAAVRAEALRARLEAELGPAAGLPKVTASIGVGALHPGDPADAFQASLALADEALYESKRAGRNRVTVAQPPPDSGAPFEEGRPLPGSARAAVDEGWVRSTLLEGALAAWFEGSLGYGPEHAGELAEAFRREAALRAVDSASEGQAVLFIPVPGRGPRAGRSLTLRTVWDVSPDGAPRLVKADKP